MNLYLLIQDIDTGYETHDAVVVSAESEADARALCAENAPPWEEVTEAYVNGTGELDRLRLKPDPVWRDGSKLTAKGLGTSIVPRGIVLASYHAG